MFTKEESDKIIRDAANEYYDGSRVDDILEDLPKKVWKKAALKQVCCLLEELIDKLEGPRDPKKMKSPPDEKGSTRWALIWARDVVEAILSR
jgi:hypothetical protein